ncbi:PIN domain-containing protein [Jeotgalibacillus soli]|uniref:PIN domain-containing protein n=1 Tax=Jeotgalibacillus soli TaxID=889306 RepID=A0A0C2VIL5_9BACL|nr:PIN domain-containing protein [Jeotgalibacillus soli]KIL44341.1 hypothetical protein KP78_33050 [Jeotgalibacillus soli]
MADKIVVDTCVFIRALFTPEDDDECTLFINALDRYDARLVFSQYTIGELLYMIKKISNEINSPYEHMRKKLDYISFLFQHAKSVNTSHTKSDFTATDRNDQMFVDAAVESDANHIITIDLKSGILEMQDAPFIPMKPIDYFLKHGVK